MPKTNEEIVKALIVLANSKEVLVKCEPQVMWHENMNGWQVSRVLEAIRILEERENG